MQTTDTADFTIETTPTPRFRLYTDDVKEILDSFDRILYYAAKKDRESMQIAGEKFFALVTHQVSDSNVAMIQAQAQQFARQFTGEPDMSASTITFHVSEPTRLTIQFDDRPLTDGNSTLLTDEYASTSIRRIRERMYKGVDRNGNGVPGFSGTVSITNTPDDGLHLASQTVGGAKPSSWLHKVIYSWLRKKEWSSY